MFPRLVFSLLLLILLGCQKEENVPTKEAYCSDRILGSYGVEVNEVHYDAAFPDEIFDTTYNAAVSVTTKDDTLVLISLFPDDIFTYVESTGDTCLFMNKANDSLTVYYYSYSIWGIRLKDDDSQNSEIVFQGTRPVID
ncbi:MAG: hypothetical protein RIB86_13940 [Imperialibacter sp.]